MIVELPVYLMTEWDVPKGKERQETLWKYESETMLPMVGQLTKEGVFDKITAFGDNTGHIVWIIEFTDTDAFGKLWSNQEYHKAMSGLALIVDNLRNRLGRPIINRTNS